MAEKEYSSELGLSEVSAGYTDALKQVGKQDNEGHTIGISYFSSTGLQAIPLTLRIIGFVLLLMLPLLPQPFSWLSVDSTSPQFLIEPQSLEIFSWFTWVPAVFVYLAYFGVSSVKNGFYTGQPGAEIHFELHKKIVKTVKPGEYAILVDPRIKPYAAVSTKSFVLTMPEVQGTTKDNMTLNFRSAFVMRVVDTFRLLEQGGFDKFLRQISGVYTSTMKDAIVGVKADEFNRFFIEPVSFRLSDSVTETNKQSITERLVKLENSELSVELLTELSEIDELDVSTFDLSETPHPVRKTIIPKIQQVASSYGIQIEDHIPKGNLTSDEYLKTLALPMVSSIARISQASETLKDITREEIEEEIAAMVAGKQLGVLEVVNTIKQIESTSETLRDEENVNRIVATKQSAIANIGQGLLAGVMSTIESQLEKVRAKSIGTTGAEMYVTESDRMLTGLERSVDQYVPQIDRVMTDKISMDELLPDLDVVDALYKRTGMEKVLANMEAQVDQTQTDTELEEIERTLEGINVEEQVEKIQTALSLVTASSGVSTEEYSPARVNEKILEIARRADVDVHADNPGGRS